MEQEFELTVEVGMAPAEQRAARARLGLVGRGDGGAIPLRLNHTGLASPDHSTVPAHRFPVVLARQWARWRTFRKTIIRRRRRDIRESLQRLPRLMRAPRRPARRRASRRSTAPSRPGPQAPAVEGFSTGHTGAAAQ